MQFVVTVNRSHKISVDLKVDSAAPASIEAQVIPDLSKCDLFRDPARSSDRSASEHSFLDFKLAVRNAFAALDFIENPSPLVRKLIKIRDEQVPAQLKQLASDAPLLSMEPPQLLMEAAESAEFSKAFRRLIKRIDRELPEYFSAEKELGTWRWIRSGLKDELPFATEFRSNEAGTARSDAEAFSLLSQDGRTIFDAKRNSAILNQQLPDAREIWQALCVDGTLPTSLLELNRAMVLCHAAEPLKGSWRIASESSFDSHLRTLKGARAVLLGSAACMACTNLGLAVVNFSLTGWSPETSTRAVLVGLWVAIGTYWTLLMNRRVARRRELSSEREALREKLELRPPKDILSNFTDTALKYLSAYSMAADRTHLAPDSSVVNEILHHHPIDPRVLPVRQGDADESSADGIEIAIESAEATADFDHHILVLNAMTPMANQLTYADAAFGAWNMLHAVRLLNAAMQPNAEKRRNLPGSLQTLLKSGQVEWCSAPGVYPELAAAFAASLQRAGLTPESWPHISRALFAKDLLDRIDARRRAKEIANEELSKAFNAK